MTLLAFWTQLHFMLNSLQLSMYSRMKLDWISSIVVTLWFTIFFGVCLLIPNADANSTCFSCTDSVLTSECLEITQCGKHESCYLDVIITSGVEVVFDMGCRDSMFCDTDVGIRRRGLDVDARAAHDLLVCTECCSGDMCNSHLCEQQGLAEVGPACYSCPQELEPDSCNVVKYCGRDQVCQLERFVSPASHRILYETKCATQSACEKNMEVLQTAIVGKRYSNHLSSGSGVMLQCCNTSLCNNARGLSNSAGSHITLSTVADHCSSNPCDHGSCFDGPDSYICQCDPGYTGVNCDEDENLCASNPCVHGTCFSYADHFSCICEDGYTGATCSEVAGHCSSSPCVNGSCFDSPQGFVCICNTGYEGDTCTKVTVVDQCASNPCVHGTCHGNDAGFSCTCAQNYTGDTCDVALDACSSSPCVHGTCYSGSGGHVCECSAGYTGTECDVDDNCSPDPCVFGTCTGTTLGYTCTCVAGYEGETCNQASSYCASQPCEHGTCFDGADGYVCQCNDGYKGTNCDDFDHCSSNPCVNGSCVDTTDGFTCNCYTGYEGTLCNLVHSHCASSPCVNNGTCFDGEDGYLCQCEHGYKGANCEFLTCAQTDPCQHGCCVESDAGYHCICDVGYSGKTCSQASSVACGPFAQGLCLDMDNGYRCPCSNLSSETVCPGGELTWCQGEGAQNFNDGESSYCGGCTSDWTDAQEAGSCALSNNLLYIHGGSV